MKKYFIALGLVVISANVLLSCKPKLKDVNGVVTDVDITGNHTGDTVHTMCLFNGEDTLLFKMDDAQYSNGLMLKGDSVDVSYIQGKGDTLRALLVHVKPTPAKVINIKTDTTKTLLTK